MLLAVPRAIFSCYPPILEYINLKKCFWAKQTGTSQSARQNTSNEHYIRLEGSDLPASSDLLRSWLTNYGESLSDIKNFNSRINKFIVSNTGVDKVGKNIMTIRFSCINNKIELDWINLSLNSNISFSLLQVRSIKDYGISLM